MAAHACFCLTWLKTPKTGFFLTRLILQMVPRQWFSCDLLSLSLFVPYFVCLWCSVCFVYDSLVTICWERAVLLAFHLCFTWYHPFHIWCFGQDVEFDCISDWSLLFYLPHNDIDPQGRRGNSGNLAVSAEGGTRREVSTRGGLPLLIRGVRGASPRKSSSLEV